MKLIKPIYRTKQWSFGKAIWIMTREPKLIRGEGSIHKIPKMLKKSAKMSVLVATTPGFIRRGSLKSFFGELETLGIKLAIFSEVVPDPTIECVERLALEYTRNKCEALIAIGGGSVIDCSKAAAARIANPEKGVRQMRGNLKVKKKLPDFYAVPTTAGTGSEATAASVVTDTVDGRHYKYSINDIRLIPKYAILDPQLSLTLPSEITADTGMDALTHAVEAFINKYPSAKTQKASLEAIKLIYENLPKAYKNGQNISARENMLYASFKGGVAITNNFVGYVHAIAHGIGALYGIAHGHANAIILPYVLEEYGESVHKPLAELAVAVGLVNESALFDGEVSEAKAAAKFINSIKALNVRLAIPKKIDKLNKKDFKTIIKRAIKEANYTYPVPRVWGKSEFKRVLKNLLP